MNNRKPISENTTRQSRETMDLLSGMLDNATHCPEKEGDLRRDKTKTKVDDDEAVTEAGHMVKK